MSVFDNIEHPEFPINDDGAIVYEANDHKVHFNTGNEVELTVETGQINHDDHDYTKIHLKDLVGDMRMRISYYDPTYRKIMSIETDNLTIETWGTWEMDVLVNFLGYAYKMLKKQIANKTNM